MYILYCTVPCTVQYCTTVLAYWLDFGSSLSSNLTTVNMAKPLSSSHLIQDVAPQGGFKPVNFRRAIPNRGFGPWTIAAASAFALTYGFYQIGQGNLHRR